MVKVSTSVLSVDKENSIKVFNELEFAKTDFFHIDVMDGKFVETDNIEIMKEYSSMIKNISNIPLDVHLMCENVKFYIEEFGDFEPNNITIHFESFKEKEEIMEMIKFIKQKNIKAGISIKPNTKIEEIYEFLPYIHLVLIMSVEPGKGGQSFIKESSNKIQMLSKYIKENNLEVDIEVDGGINLETVESIKQSGANIIVAGTAIISSNNYKNTIEKIRI